MTLVGAVPRGALPELPSRHLGLVSADGHILTEETLDALAHAAESHLDIDAICDLASAAPHFEASEASQSPQQPCRIGVAWDEAFHFYYQDFFDALEARGATVMRFSPIHDATLPSQLDALYFGGGYPEAHAEALESNTTLRHAIRAFAASGRPVYAECGGLMYLAQGMKDIEFIGLLPTTVSMLPRRKALGYVEAELSESSLFGGTGTRIRGHEFHYSELDASPIDGDGWRSVYRLRRNRSGEMAAEGYQKGNVLASYAHLHLASHPEALDHFLTLCRRSS